MIEILKYNEIDIYFFDEHNYEWMSFRTTLEDGGSCLIGDGDIRLFGYRPETVKSIHSALSGWFGSRTPEDDACAIQAAFTAELSPENIFVLDATPEVNGYQGGSGYRQDTLIKN